MAIINNNPDLLVPDPLVDPTPTTANFCYLYKPGFDSLAIAYSYTKVDNNDFQEVATFSTSIRLSGARASGKTFKENVPGPANYMDTRQYIQRKSGNYFFSVPQTQPGETIISVEISNPASSIELEVMQNPGMEYFDGLQAVAGKNKMIELNNGSIVTTFLDDRGDPEMAVDGSVTPVEFTYEVPSGKIFLMSGLTLLVSTNVNIPDAFGHFAHLPALTNGVTIATDSNPPSFVIRENAEIATYAQKTEDGGPFGKSGKQFTAHLDYEKITCGNCATIYNIVKAVVSDDLSGLDGFRISVKGYLV